jgi:PhnB protein
MAKKKTKTKPKMKAKPKAKAKAKRTVARPKQRARTKRTAPAKPAGPSWRAAGYQFINAFLTVRDVAQAIDFYVNGFGFKLRGSMPGPDGKIMHAELMHNDSVIMMGPENPQVPAPQGPSPVTIFVYVDNVDAVTARAAAAGAQVMQQPRDEFWGDRCSILIDPQGHSWMLGTHVRDVSMAEMQQSMG